jgi:hypothetical protein
VDEGVFLCTLTANVELERGAKMKRRTIWKIGVDVAASPIGAPGRDPASARAAQLATRNAS